MAVVTAVIGIWLISIGMIGHLFRPVPPWRRPIFVVAGACLLIPDQIGAWAVGTDAAGAILGGLLVTYELTRRKGPSATAVIWRSRATRP